MKLALSLSLALIAAGASAHAEPVESKSSFVIAVDPRIELLGVVQYLAGRRDARVPLPVQYGKDIERSFGRRRDHEAVKLYRELSEKYQEFGVDLLFLSNPPSLSPTRTPPFGGGSADLERFLEALRRFAVDGDFARFYAEHRKAYRDFETSARREAGARDFPRIVEDYVGRSLESRCRYILSLAYAPKRGMSYIIPYPDPEQRPDEHGPYEVDVLLTPETADGRSSFFGLYRGMLLDELIYVDVERTYISRRISNLKTHALLAALGGECRELDCLKDAVVRAVGRRLAAGARRGKKADSAVDLFALRLADYENSRERYRSLDEFYPRLFAVPEAAETARAASSSETLPKPKATSGGNGSPSARSQ